MKRLISVATPFRVVTGRKYLVASDGGTMEIRKFLLNGGKALVGTLGDGEESFLQTDSEGEICEFTPNSPNTQLTLTPVE